MTGLTSSGEVPEERECRLVLEGTGLYLVDSVTVDEGVEGIASASAAGASRGRKMSDRIIKGGLRPSRPQDFT